MDNAARLFGLDTVMIDLVLKVGELPARGGDAAVSERLVTTGGGFNAMSAARRQGMNVTYVGQIGRGPFAAIAARELEEEGIEVAVPAREGLDLGLCIVLVERDGERTFITSPGAEGTLRASELMDVPMSEGDYVFLSGYNFVYPEICAETLTWLSKVGEGVVIAFDPGPRVSDITADALREVFARTDWLLCNATEAASLVGGDAVPDVTSRLLEVAGRRGVVVRRGDQGCVVAPRGENPIEVHAVETVVLDTNGAGDVHNGVFLAELSRGTGVEESARRANIAAAIAIATLGPATCPTRDVVDDRLRAGSQN